jgi:hypothetical protein
VTGQRQGRDEAQERGGVGQDVVHAQRRGAKPIIPRRGRDL